MNNNNYISLIAIVLIYIYWKNKKPKTNGGGGYICPESIRDALSLPSAGSYWGNESNNLSIYSSQEIEQEYGSDNLEYGICMTATQNGLDLGELTEKDVHIIRTCACSKMIGTNDFNASSFTRVSTFI